jgi:hypothetical protein
MAVKTWFSSHLQVHRCELPALRSTISTGVAVFGLSLFSGDLVLVALGLPALQASSVDDASLAK